TNTEPPGAFNASSMAYLTLYGPEGGVLDSAASDPLGLPEPTLSGHPAIGYFRAAAPGGGRTTVTVAWDVPGLVNRMRDGTWEYSLRWMHLPDHTGDVVNLTFELPPGWQWKDEPPPDQFSLDQEMLGSWRLDADD
ncbi:MAG: hypothetical protein ACRDTE_25460, partial [Pseudonocardiaceae bacterium]